MLKVISGRGFPETFPKEKFNDKFLIRAENHKVRRTESTDFSFTINTDENGI